MEEAINQMIYLGIDPGLDGCCAVFLSRTTQTPILIDTPTLPVGKRRKINAYELLQELLHIIGTPHNKEIQAALELVHAMPGQGVSSMFSMGFSSGLWEGILVTLGIPFEYVAPQTWKRAMLAGMPKEKAASRWRVQQMFPQVDVSLKKHHGRADAILIAEWLRRKS